MPHRMDSIVLKEGLQGYQFSIRDEGHGRARSPHSSGSSGTVRVSFLVHWVVIVNHMTDVAKVETATGNICGHQECNLITAKTIKYGSSLRLFQTSVDVFQRVKLFPKIFQEFVPMMPGVTKDNGLGDRLFFKIFRQGSQSITPTNMSKMMNQALGRYLRLIQFDLYRVFQVSSDEPVDLIRHRCCKEQRLMFMDETGQDKVHVFNETHFQHCVRFIEGQGTNMREVDGRGVIKEVNQSSGGGDKDMNSVT